MSHWVRMKEFGNIKSDHYMKKLLLGLITILTVLGACQKNEVSVELSEAVTIHATIEDNDATKTVMDESNNILWSENDQIIAFMKSSYGHKYQVKPSFVGKSYAEFSLVSSGDSNDLLAGNEWDHNVVYYPYSENIECLKSGANYALEVNLPSEQVYVPDSFANGSMAMVAVSESNNITFKNVLGGIKLQLKGTQKVASIKIEGKNNEKLSGAAVVTAYTDETKPAITMASGASTSVTLNCGEGVQLNESTATEFIISLPPVLFSQGFTVTVADTESNTYTVETDKANTVLRSSILTMPAFKLGEIPDSGSPEDAVDMIFFDITNLTVVPKTTYTLTVDFEPYNAADKTLVWNSSNPSVASVDASGEIKALADGTSTITAVAIGGATANCTVTVKSCIVPSVDYIADGVNYGKGIAIGNVVWAPVNCGYKPKTGTSKGFPYGKLYQWGREHGQGFKEEYDESAPEMIEGPLEFENAIRNKYSNTFIKITGGYPYGPWYDSSTQNTLWNSGTDAEPIKTEYDPCPEGWRVPTNNELNELWENHSIWENINGQLGYYFSGRYTYLDAAPKVFMIAAGYREGDGDAYSRNGEGYYWGSQGDTHSTRFILNSGWIGTMSGSISNGCSVRCVQE